MAPSDGALFRRGADVLARRQPAAWAAVEAAGEPVSRLVVEDGRAVNIDLGGTRLYPAPAPGWTRGRLDAYFRDPDRIRFQDPAGARLTRHSSELLADLDGYLADRTVRVDAPFPSVDVGYAFVFGIGLGHHVGEILHRTRCRHLVLVEPVVEFLRHSLSAVDWKAILDEAEAQGTAVHFRLGRDPEQLVLEIEAILIHGRGAAFLDGSYAYLHYESWATREARLLWNQRVRNFLVRPNTFDDERLMLENSRANLASGGFRIVAERPYPAEPAPLFVVGSGPSLDSDLPHLKALAPNAMIASCGSSLGVLLANGIRPDLHVENENTLPLVENLKGFRAAHGLDGIALVASTTIPPEAAALFSRRWFYFRAPLSPVALLSAGTPPIPYAGPLVTNAALAGLTTLGFRAVTLFGVDCGRRPDKGHHARDSVYYRPGYANFIEGESLAFIEGEFSRVVPGNFGGEVLTSAYFDLSRRTITELCRVRGLDLVNCSDGARIDGARPRAASALGLDGPPLRKWEVMQRIEDHLPGFVPGQFPVGKGLARHLAACDTLAQAWRRLLEVSRAEDDGFWALERRIDALRRGHSNIFDGVLRLVGGSLESMARIAVFRGNRIAGAEARHAFFRFFLDRYDGESRALFADARALLAELAAQVRP